MSLQNRWYAIFFYGTSKFGIHKDIFACLFSIHNIISLSCHEQVCLCLCLSMFYHDMINLLYQSLVFTHFKCLLKTLHTLSAF